MKYRHIYGGLPYMVLTLFLALLACSAPEVAQEEKPCMKSPDDELMRFSRADLEDSACFTWFRPAYREYSPNPAFIEKLKPYRENMTAVVFAGSWCEDTRRLLPQFYKVMETVKVPSENITLIPVNRKKKSTDGRAEAMKIEIVPTFIFYYGGKEIGRVAEAAPGPIEKLLVGMVE